MDERMRIRESSDLHRACVCLAGHVATAAVDLSPEKVQPFCVACGQRTLTACPACASPIPGLERGGLWSYVLPYYCPRCGGAYPWTQAFIEAAEELAGMLTKNKSEEEEL